MYDQFRGVLVAPRSESDFQIRFVELFTDGLVVHYTALMEFDHVLTGNEDPNALLARRKERDELTWITVTDDCDTQYVPGSGGMSGSNRFHRGHRSFRPSVPRDATTLTVATRLDSVTMRLGDLAPPPF